MNKVYKVIWSNARKCYVVVSEIAKNHGKNNTKNIVSRLAARMGGCMLQMASAMQLPGALLAAFLLSLIPETRLLWPMVPCGLLLNLEHVFPCFQELLL